MKLAVITPFPPTKLPEADHGLRLCERLAAANVELQVLTTANGVSAASPSLNVAAVMKDCSWSEAWKIRQFLRTSRPDGVLLFYMGLAYFNHPMITFAPTLLKKLSPQTPFVTQFSFPLGPANWQAPLNTRAGRKLAEAWAGPGVDYVYGTLLRDSDRIIVFSEAHRRMLAEHDRIVDEKSILIPPPAFQLIAPENAPFYRQRIEDRFQIDRQSFLIVYFGYIYHGKGVETLLKAFQIAAQKNPRLRLLMVGGFQDDVKPADRHYAAELRALANELDLDGRVAWTGNYPWDSDVASSYLRAADLCVLPFDRGLYLNNSSFSMAAAHGLPIISTRASFVESAFSHEENVFLCPPKDPPAMAAAIETLVNDPVLRHRLHRGAEQMAREWFAWDRVIERTLAAFRPADNPRPATTFTDSSRELTLSR